MSGLAEAVRAATKGAGSRCAVAVVLESLKDGVDRHDLTEFLVDPAVTGAALARGLTAIGHDIKSQTITRHRAGECACP